MVSHALGEWKAPPHSLQRRPTSSETKPRGVGQVQGAVWNKLVHTFSFRSLL